MKRFVLLALALPFMVGASCQNQVARCLAKPTKAEIETCLTDGLEPTPAQPTATATSTPTVAPTVSPTAAPTVAPRWTVTIKLVNGFGGCNPRETQAEALAHPRARCDGDRTYLFTMPDFDLVPKGTGCRELWGSNPDQSLYNRCMNNDSPGTPCNGAAACDQDHLACPRTNYGCNGRELGDPRGSVLRVSSSSVSCVSEKNPGFSIECTGTPGDTYLICARPFLDPHDENGVPLPVQGTGENCKSGYF